MNIKRLRGHLPADEEEREEGAESRRDPRDRHAERGNSEAGAPAGRRESWFPLAVPNGDRMAILEQTLQTTNGRRYHGAATGGAERWRWS